jgi:hypothetical protein
MGRILRISAESSPTCSKSGFVKKKSCAELLRFPEEVKFRSSYYLVHHIGSVEKAYLRPAALIGNGKMQSRLAAAETLESRLRYNRLPL